MIGWGDDKTGTIWDKIFRSTQGNEAIFSWSIILLWFEKFTSILINDMWKLENHSKKLTFYDFFSFGSLEITVKYWFLLLTHFFFSSSLVVVFPSNDILNILWGFLTEFYFDTVLLVVEVIKPDLNSFFCLFLKEGDKTKF